MIPAQVGAQAAATRKMNARQAGLLNELYGAVTDERLKTLIGDIDVNPVNGQGSGRRAWLLIERECSEPMTDLIIRSIQTKFNQATMRSAVGFSESTITDFNRYQNATAARLPLANQPDETTCTLKLLECISAECPNPALALEATKELQANGAARRFVRAQQPGQAVGQMRDLQAAVSYFDGMWRTLVQACGDSRRPRSDRNRNLQTQQVCV